MKKLIAVVFTLVFVASTGSMALASDGESLFSKKCKTCHSTGTNKILGPGLAGISQRADEAWLKAWIADPQGVWEANEGYTQTLKKEVGGESRSKTRMKVRVKPDEVDAIVEYLKTL